MNRLLVIILSLGLIFPLVACDNVTSEKKIVNNQIKIEKNNLANEVEAKKTNRLVLDMSEKEFKERALKDFIITKKTLDLCLEVDSPENKLALAVYDSIYYDIQKDNNKELLNFIKSNTNYLSFKSIEGVQSIISEKGKEWDLMKTNENMLNEFIKEILNQSKPKYSKKTLIKTDNK